MTSHPLAEGKKLPDFQVPEIRDTCADRRMSFGGNMQLTVALLMGSEEDAQREALRCIEIGGRQGFVLAPGCDLPYQTPARNLEAVAELVHDPYRQDVVRTLSRSQSVEHLLDTHDYGMAEKVILDVITLDSESCAPCQYTMEVVRSAVAEFKGIVEYREHKIKESNSVLFMKSLMVRNIPTVCIDGKITFVSKIPTREELVTASEADLRKAQLPNPIQERIGFRDRGESRRMRAGTTADRTGAS